MTKTHRRHQGSGYDEFVRDPYGLFEEAARIVRDVFEVRACVLADSREKSEGDEGL